jgi:hypothetical protein
MKRRKTEVEAGDDVHGQYRVGAMAASGVNNDTGAPEVMFDYYDVRSNEQVGWLFIDAADVEPFVGALLDEARRARAAVK